MGKWLEAAKAVRGVMDKAGTMLDDRQASEVAALYRTMPLDGRLVKSGTRINWNGQLKRAAADLWATEENTPDAAPDLWEDIAYKDGYRMIPETLTEGTAFASGEKGWWKDVLYESKLDANVWTPDAYPDGWKVCE